MKEKNLMTAALFALSMPAYAGYFGYYHANTNGVLATRGHTNAILYQTANPSQPLEAMLAAHPGAKLIVEFGVLTVRFRGQNGCNYGKCMDFDPARAKLILDAVEETLLKLHRSRIAAFMVIDEIETNPESVIAAEALLDAIRARPAFDGIPLWGNFDNVFRHHTGHDFTVPRGLDWVSLTPSYGQACFYQTCEAARYRILSEASQELKLAVVGDAWAQSSDLDPHGELSSVGQAHLFKIEALWALAGQQGMEVVGYFPFSYSEPGPYTLVSAPAVIKQAWADMARKVIFETVPVTGSEPEPAPEPEPERPPITFGNPPSWVFNPPTQELVPTPPPFDFKLPDFSKLPW